MVVQPAANLEDSGSIPGRLAVVDAGVAIGGLGFESLTRRFTVGCFTTRPLRVLQYVFSQLLEAKSACLLARQTVLMRPAQLLHLAVWARFERFGHHTHTHTHTYPPPWPFLGVVQRCEEGGEADHRLEAVRRVCGDGEVALSEQRSAGMGVRSGGPLWAVAVDDGGLCWAEGDTCGAVPPLPLQGLGPGPLSPARTPAFARAAAAHAPARARARARAPEQGARSRGWHAVRATRARRRTWGIGRIRITSVRTAAAGQYGWATRATGGQHRVWPWEGRRVAGLYHAARPPGGVGLGWVKASSGPPGPRTSPFPTASQLVRRGHGCPVSRPAGLMTAPVPRGGTRGREMPPCLCVWGARAAWGSVSPGAPGPGGEAGGA